MGNDITSGFFIIGKIIPNYIWNQCVGYWYLRTCDVLGEHLGASRATEKRHWDTYTDADADELHQYLDLSVCGEVKNTHARLLAELAKVESELRQGYAAKRYAAVFAQLEELSDEFLRLGILEVTNGEA